MRKLTLEAAKFNGGFLQHLMTLNSSGILILLALREKFGPGYYYSLTLESIKLPIMFFAASLLLAFVALTSLSLYLLADPRSPANDSQQVSQSPRQRRRQASLSGTQSPWFLLMLTFTAAAAFLSGLFAFAWPLLQSAP